MRTECRSRALPPAFPEHREAIPHPSELWHIDLRTAQAYAPKHRLGGVGLCSNTRHLAWEPLENSAYPGTIEDDRFERMNAAVRGLLKRRLSRKAFRRASYWWWYGKTYFPRRVASDIFRTRRNSTVHGLPSEILDQVRQVNIFAPTPICRIMTRHGSDKGGSWHSYSASK